MKVQVSFNIINPEYKQKYADQFHLGKESESNNKYDWGKTYEVANVKSVELIEDGIYHLQGETDEGEAFDFAIPKITMFRLHLENGEVSDFAVSKSILNKTHQARNEKYETMRCYFYINAEPKSIQLGDGLVVNVGEVPEEMKG